MTKYSQMQNKWTQNFKKNNYDTITAYARKGQRDEYKEYAQSLGLSLNNLIIQLLDRELVEQSFKKK